MPVYKNDKNGTWYAMVRYKDWTGQNKQKCQRGFATRREALEWEAQFKLQKTADIDMTLEAFYELYEQDVRPRLKENTWLTKQVIIEKKILPYLGKRKLSEITAKDVIDWQNAMMKLKKPNGEPLSPCYLKTIHAELSALFNHAAKYYELHINPARNAGCMGQEENKEMSFWTKEEYLKFAEAIMNRPISYYAFEILYWCGIREGELLALTPADFDFDKAVLRINKSYQRIHGEDVVTTPCNLRRASATDALTNGRLADQNGRPPDNPNSVLQLDHHDIMLGDPLEDCVSRYCIVHDHGLPFVWFPLGTDDRAP